MTAQPLDGLIYRGEEFCIVGVKGKGLLKPVDFGIRCYGMGFSYCRGFVMTYLCEGGSLYVKDMLVNLREDSAPLINGRPPDSNDPINGMTQYFNIRRHTPFSGGLLIGRDFISESYVHQGFAKSYQFRTVSEMKFVDGKLSSVREVSTNLDGARRRSVRYRDVMRWIKECYFQRYTIG